MVNEPTEDIFSDTDLLEILEQWTNQEGTDVNGAASDVWLLKAANYAELVDVTEAGSTRKLGSMHTNALKMAKEFGALSAASVQLETARPRTREIVRPT
jgi:hypothetical protein